MTLIQYFDTSAVSSTDWLGDYMTLQAACDTVTFAISWVVWFGRTWSGLTWLGLVWSGMAWSAAHAPLRLLVLPCFWDVVSHEAGGRDGRRLLNRAQLSYRHDARDARGGPPAKGR